MTPINFKDANYSVKIDVLDTSFLKLLINLILSKFVLLPNDLFPGPQKITKLMKLLLKHLILQRQIVVIFINDYDRCYSRYMPP